MKHKTSLKSVPSGAFQHITAGPYSPVLQVDTSRLIVLSGQVAVDREGHVIGSTIEEQTEATLANCSRLLSDAGASFADVFKVNVYLSDIGDWKAFNAVYARVLPQPDPARTAVQAVLISPFIVELDMWAALPGNP
jgi:2-iminobutanoate/2-iminopropanoate deaminase